MNEDKTYDIAIIGSGVVGLAAGMYAGRLELDTIILGDKYGGTLVLTDVVENYPGFKKLTGLELANKLKEHAMEYKEFVALKSAFVKEVTGNADAGFVLETNKEKFKAKTVIFTTGTKDKELPVPGHNEFKNRGVQYCALCDGALFKDKVVALVGGSDSAAKEALVLARFCKKVYMIYRGTAIHPEPVNGVRVKNTENIEIIYETNVTEIHGDTMVTHLTLDKPHKGSAEFKVDGIFIAIGHIPLTGVAEKLGVTLNEKNEIIINRKSETNIPGIFAAGDCCDTDFKQAIVGVGESVSAVYSAYTFIAEKEVPKEDASKDL